MTYSQGTFSFLLVKLGVLTFVAAMILVLPGCELFRPKPPPNTATVTHAKKQPSALDPLKSAQQYSSEADRKAAQALARLGDAKSGLAYYRGRALNLQDMVKKLQEKGSAAATDLKLLYDELALQDIYIIELAAKLDTVEEDLEEEGKLRVLAQSKLRETQNLLVAKEQEADTLRQQLADADSTIIDLEENAAENFTKAQKANSAADKVRGQRNMLAWTLLGVTVAALASLIVNYIQFRSSRLLPI